MRDRTSRRRWIAAPEGSVSRKKLLAALASSALAGGLIVGFAMLDRPTTDSTPVHQQAIVAGAELKLADTETLDRHLRPTPTTAVLPTQRPAAQPLPSPIQSATTGTVTLSEKDYGTTKVVAAGTTIAVQLRGVANFRWTVPSASDNQVVRQTAGSQGSDGSATARFLAVAAGRAVLSAIDNPNCFPICELPPAGGWIVTIIVE